MTPKKRTMSTLFHTEGRRHRDIKLCRGSAAAIEVDDLYGETSRALEASVNETITPTQFFDEDYPVVDVRTL